MPTPTAGRGGLEVCLLLTAYCLLLTAYLDVVVSDGAQQHRLTVAILRL